MPTEYVSRYDSNHTSTSMSITAMKQTSGVVFPLVLVLHLHCDGEGIMLIIITKHLIWN